jgi:hypothetical protein
MHIPHPSYLGKTGYTRSLPVALAKLCTRFWCVKDPEIGNLPRQTTPILILEGVCELRNILHTNHKTEEQIPNGANIVPETWWTKGSNKVTLRQGKI